MARKKNPIEKITAEGKIKLSNLVTEEILKLSVDDVKRNLEIAEKHKASVATDFCYWLYAEEVAYWKSILNLLLAAEITGPDELPDVSKPILEGRPKMDVQYDLVEWSEKVLVEANKVRKKEEKDGEEEKSN